jgi:hypothetical protein
MPNIGREEAKAAIINVLKTGKKVEQFCKIADGFYQIESAFFLMSYMDYVALENGGAQACKSIAANIAAGDYRGKKMSDDKISDKNASVGTWMYEHYIANAAIGGLKGLSNQINLGQPTFDALTAIYNSPGKPFTSASYFQAYTVTIKTLVNDVRYSVAYCALA